MSIKNAADRYGWLSIALHWIMALLFFFLFGLGIYMLELGYYDPWYRSSFNLHKSLGLLFLILLAIRLSWHGFSSAPKPKVTSQFEHKIAVLTHKCLYVGMLLLPVSGYLISTADGRSVEFFSTFELPALPWSIDKQEEISGQIHAIFAWIFISTASLHAIAALKHHFYDRDDTLKRMCFITTKISKTKEEI